MGKISDITGEDLKAQLSEYHLVVAEVIGGISFDIVETKNRLKKLEEQYSKALQEIEELKTVTRLLVQASLPKEG